ncbi:MAG TPA: phosphoenolpyruvate--protein phosphotransferase [bacterium]|nr:phosphoenolpyruvate--protein phosphotransferase [bacterium]HNS49075.1 phosphoenolpyruvate--protein phosphotransferase [bacterium]
MTKFQGIGVSPGIAIGPVYRLPDLHQKIPDHRLPPEEVEAELQRLDRALEETERELEKIRVQAAKNLGSAAAEIFNVHLLLLKDRGLKARLVRQVKEGWNAAYAVTQVLHDYLDSFQRIDNSFLKDRRGDLEDVGKRLVRNLLGLKIQLSDIREKVILVGYNLSPSETASLSKKDVVAFVTEVGGPTSHTAIMARSLEIPAVVGLKGIDQLFRSGAMMIVDGQAGVVILDPDERLVREYTRMRSNLREASQALESLRGKTATTRDGHRVCLGANIEMPTEDVSVLSHGADEIGLFRTEFLYLNRDDLPDEEEQFRAYRRVVEKLRPMSVTIRTLDLGGDKFSSALGMPEEVNPFLGWRAIRFCLARPDIFRVQLRAILRASAHGKVRMMYPLISDLEEVKAARAILEEVKEGLRREGRPFDEKMPVGAMIEVPSAALAAGAIARRVDFFSLGTNDLIQYSLAVDRVNERTAHLYNPFHPSVLMLIDHVVKAARAAGIGVGLCGEMAADPATAFLLIGLGLDHLSMAPLAIPQVKQVIRLTNYREARRFARRILAMESAEQIAGEVRDNHERLLARESKGRPKKKTRSDDQT